MNERWKNVRGIRGYEVSNRGRVRNKKGTLKLFPANGYLAACMLLNGIWKTKYVHTLVLETFVGPRPPKMQCRHSPDRTRTNNNLSNLQWGTAKQNHEDAVRDGTHSGLRYVGENHFRATISNRKARQVKRHLRKTNSLLAVAAATGVALHTVRNIKSGAAYRTA